MIVFWDTSAFVPLIMKESATPSALRLWTKADRVVASRLMYVEVVAALAMARRMGRIGSRTHRTARRAVDRLHGSVDCVEVSESLIRRATSLSEQLNLRGYEAVHCASAETLADDDLVVASGDRALLEACKTLGLNVAPMPLGNR